MFDDDHANSGSADDLVICWYYSMHINDLVWLDLKYSCWINLAWIDFKMLAATSDKNRTSSIYIAINLLIFILKISIIY